MRSNVRDHIESQKNDHRPSYMPCRGLPRPRQLKLDLCEIFEAPQFSTFSTASVKRRNTRKEQMISDSGGRACPGFVGCQSTRRAHYASRAVVNASLDTIRKADAPIGDSRWPKINVVPN
jgi:hypothetical protein